MGDDRSAAAVFGRQLKALRHRRGLTLADVSRALEGIGVSASTARLSRVENAERGVSLDLALAVCRALDASLADLLAGEHVSIGTASLTDSEVMRVVGGPVSRDFLKGFAAGAQREVGAELAARLVERGLEDWMNLQRQPFSEWPPELRHVLVDPDTGQPLRLPDDESEQ